VNATAAVAACDGLAYSEELGGPRAIVDRGRVTVESLPGDLAPT
jgi:hypothetical protein